MLLNSPFWIIYRLDNSLVLPCQGLFNCLLITSSINRSAHVIFYVLCFVCWICPVTVSSNFLLRFLQLPLQWVYLCTQLFLICLNCLPKSFQYSNIIYIGLQLYPYHLADYICRVMRISPFRYYCDILFEAMKNGNPFF